MANKRKLIRKPAPTLRDKLDAIKAAVYAKREAALKAAPDKKSPPFDPATFLDTTRVGGKTLGKWDKLITKRIEDGSGKGFYIVDLTDLPEWVSWAVNQWKGRGAPTAQSITKDKIRDLEAKINDYEKFAALDAAEAAKLISPKLSPGIRVSNKPLAEKKMKQSQSKFDKAVALREEAEKLKKELDDE